MTTADGVEVQDGDRVFPAWGYEAIVGTDEMAKGVEYYSTPLAAKLGALWKLQDELADTLVKATRLHDQIALLQSDILSNKRVRAAISQRPATKPAALATETA